MVLRLHAAGPLSVGDPDPSSSLCSWASHEPLSACARGDVSCRDVYRIDVPRALPLAQGEWESLTLLNKRRPNIIFSSGELCTLTVGQRPCLAEKDPRFRDSWSTKVYERRALLAERRALLAEQASTRRLLPPLTRKPWDLRSQKRGRARGAGSWTTCRT